jgi:putative membrane protein
MFPFAGFGYGAWWIFPLFMLVMMVLCIFLMRGRMGSMMCCGHGGDTKDSALDTLKKRYARGELNNDEYEQKRREITEHN